MMIRNICFLVATVCIALVFISSLFSNPLSFCSGVDSVQCSTPKVGNVIYGESVGAASTGTLFSGEKFRTGASPKSQDVAEPEKLQLGAGPSAAPSAGPGPSAVSSAGPSAAPSGTRRGPDSFCSSQQYVLEHRNFRDIICSIANNDTTNLIPLPARNNIVFYHVPKTGGESLEMALGIKKSHGTWSQRTRQGKDYEPSNNVAVTIVRNPYHRMLSWFRFCLHGYRGHLPGPEIQCLLAHEHIADALPMSTSRSAGTHPPISSSSNDTNNLEQPHTQETVSLAFESWLAKILKSKELENPWFTYTYQKFIGGVQPLRLDYIIRFEHYEADYALLAKALGMENGSLPKQNGSKEGDRGEIKPGNKYGLRYDAEVAALLKKEYQEIYTERAKELVDMVFQADLSYFNYTF
jgi:hypothetical protein